MSIPKDRVFYLEDFGAVPDGTTLNTLKIQRAIDMCSHAGGGTIRITPGVWLTGTLFMKDNVCLYLDDGATLLASPNREDYLPIARKNVRGMCCMLVSHFGNHVEDSSCLIFADGVKNIAIQGGGKIDGNGQPGIWWDAEKMCSPFVKDPNRWRPRALVAFIDCQYITIRDTKFFNASCYTLWPIACKDVVIDGIIIDNPFDGPNTDGIDIDCCDRVMVSNCNIKGGDDAIALKSDSGILGQEEIPCQNITVTNCVLQSRPANAIRLGFEGDSFIRDCTFSNITIWDSACGIDIGSTTCDRPDFTILKGSRNENITFDNITMRDTTVPVRLWLNGPADSHVVLRNIRISNLIAECRSGMEFLGLADHAMENIFLSDILLIPAGERTETGPGTALFARFVENLHVENFCVDWKNAKGAWQHGAQIQNSRKVQCDNISTVHGENIDLKSFVDFVGTTGSVRNCDSDPNIPLVTSDPESKVFQSGNN
ncbi:MAG: glycosyl hydrolase family 28 protein [Planctomycetia bacterium]|nr:glycosyl hydrolase family 28 protein [Planctomycetia bacterium]